ncbi:hypothetical protein B0H11DRAFT_2277749, partial [Mycena galericulata]
TSAGFNQRTNLKLSSKFGHCVRLIFLGASLACTGTNTVETGSHHCAVYNIPSGSGHFVRNRRCFAAVSSSFRPLRKVTVDDSITRRHI